MTSSFTKNLLAWNAASNTRAMPWKGEKDPFKIWISEVILQQTRVEQGLKYFEKFVHTYPSICSLAHAPEQQVFKLWEGLGYYSRCKNMLATARYICNELNGIFPSTYESIHALKGVGAYTAAAISSFAYNLPHAVVDGNVMRVLSRYFGADVPVNTQDGKKFYTQLAGPLLDAQQPGTYNQAIMDFGAVICKPQQPLCTICIQQKDCLAFQQKRVQQLPPKKKATKKKIRWFCYFIIECGGETYIRKRTGRDVWENLYEFVLQENDAPFFFDEAQTIQGALQLLLETDDFFIRHISEEYRQQLTHQTISAKFIEISLPAPSPRLAAFELAGKEALLHYPFPRLITRYLQKRC